VGDRPVEAQRVALGERVDIAADFDLDRPAGNVDRHLAGVNLVIGGPALAARGPFAQDGDAALPRQLAQLAAAELAGRALVAADDAHRRALAGRRPQACDRDVQRRGDPLDRAHAGTRQAALDLAQEGMRQTGEPAEPLEGQPAFPAQRANARTEVRLKTVGGGMATKHRLPD
jgi:hypothetical protein